MISIGRKCADGKAILATDKVLEDATTDEHNAQDSVAMAGERPVINGADPVSPCHARNRNDDLAVQTKGLLLRELE